MGVLRSEVSMLSSLILLSSTLRQIDPDTAYVVCISVSLGFPSLYALRWRQNGRDSGSNHQPYDCLLNRLFRHRSKKTPKLRVTGLCAGNSPGTREFPAQMTSNAENVSIWWRHHGYPYSLVSMERQSIVYLLDFKVICCILLSIPRASIR